MRTTLYEGVRPHGNRIQVSIQSGGKRRWITIDIRPTKANQLALARQREAIKSRLKQGEDAELLIAELEGKDPQAAPATAKTLGYYAQHFLDVVAPERVTDSSLMCQ